MQMEEPYVHLVVTASSRILSNSSLPQLSHYSILCQLTLHFRFRCTAFFMAHLPLVGQSLLFIKDSRSNPDITHLVGLLYASDQPHAELSI